MNNVEIKIFYVISFNTMMITTDLSGMNINGTFTFDDQ